MKRSFEWLQKYWQVVIVLVALAVYLGYKSLTKNVSTPQYQTAQAEFGSLITTVSASGNVTTGNNLAIVTNATGTVNAVYVKNGDKVTKGQKIAEITLDQDSQQKSAAAYASYLASKNSLASAQNQLWTLQNQAFAANQKFINGAVAENLASSDPNYIQQQSAWLAAEGAYINQANVIKQSQASVTSAWLNYQQLSSTITAPSTGIVANLTVASGSVISVQSSSNSSSSPQQLGTITQLNQNTQASVGLAEIDAPKVEPGQKATMTLDAFPDKTFTGKVLTIDTNGSVSSGVTTYPATIVFDTFQSSIYPNMAVTATIITNVESDVILVPSSAIKNNNGQSTIQLMQKDGSVTTVNVTVGNSNDTQTAILSGINAGDAVVTGTTSSATPSTSQTSSPFGGTGFGGGAGAMRIRD